MKIFIFVNRRVDGVSKLKALLKNIEEEDVLRVRFGNSKSFAELKDGTRY